MKTPNYSFMMLDLETLSTDPHAAIIQIGAVFHEAGSNWPDQQDFETLIKPHGVTDPATIHWHREQGTYPIVEAAETRGAELKQGLAQFKEFYYHVNPEFVMARSPSFDVTILNNACRRASIKPVIHFWQEYCDRTADHLMTELGVPKPPRDLLEYPKHHALADAKYQAFCYIYQMEQLRELLRPRR